MADEENKMNEVMRANANEAFQLLQKHVAEAAGYSLKEEAAAVQLALRYGMIDIELGHLLMDTADAMQLLILQYVAVLEHLKLRVPNNPIPPPTSTTLN